jgi:putative ABC transport system permease protein
MRLRILFKVALHSIMKKRLRSFLTMLGIIIGVSAVIIMVAIGKGAQAKIEKDIASFGVNLLMIFPESSRQGGVSRGAGSYNRITLADAEAIRRDATLIDMISPLVQSHGQAVSRTSNWNTGISGVSEEYEGIRDWNVSSGSFISARDVRVNASVAVIGKIVADNLFPNEDPIGQKLRIRNVPFTVIGVLAEKGQNTAGMDQDDIIVAPYTTVLNKLSGGRYINGIMASAINQASIGAAKEEVDLILRESHQLSEDEEADFSIRTQTEITNFIASTTQILTMLLASIAGVSLVVGGIGIMNIMLVSVTERTREIGIRLAVGARSSDVLIQFLVEAVVMSLLGGIFGILFGFGVALLISKLTGLQTLVTPGVVLLAVSFAGAVGVFFGFYPARNAARMNPIDALRYE